MSLVLGVLNVALGLGNALIYITSDDHPKLNLFASMLCFGMGLVIILTPDA